MNLHVDATAVPPGSEPTEPASRWSDAVPAQRLILWLFLVLAACTAITLVWFISVGRAQMAADVAAGTLAQDSMDATMLRLYTALAGNLASPVLVWFLLAGIAAKGAWRRFWFSAALPAALAAMAMVLIVVLLLA